MTDQVSLKEAYGGLACPAPPHAASTCPPRMSDGRAFTSYRQQCHSTATVNAASGRALSSNELRAFYTRNATRIIEQNRRAAQQHMGCSTCFDLDCSGTMLPELTVQEQGPRTAAFPTRDPAGLGMGRAAALSGPRK